MTISYVDGNVFDSDADVIAHGVNCMGAFGAGVAKQIRNRYPEVYRAYITKHTFEGWKLGDCQIVTLEDNSRQVANLATQFGYGYKRGQKVLVSYDALRYSIRSLFKYCANNNLSLAMPQIGAGLAGGDWNTIKGILEEEARAYPNLDVTVYSLLPQSLFKLI
jgi:O-acetyl-ADP-ribose deacetylase (regulator of RNase III)